MGIFNQALQSPDAWAHDGSIFLETLIDKGQNNKDDII